VELGFLELSILEQRLLGTLRIRISLRSNTHTFERLHHRR
jgi:hypothetical protein